MSGAVEYGTARLLRTNFIEEPVLGKTGTCSKDGTRFGWFGSYANTQYGRIVTVVFLEGGRPTFGPKAAELAGACIAISTITTTSPTSRLRRRPRSMRFRQRVGRNAIRNALASRAAITGRPSLDLRTK